MTVTVQRDALLAVARQVASAVKSRHEIPILSNVLLEIGDEIARLTGTDLDAQVRAECQASGDLRTTLPAEKLLAALESLKPGAVTIAPGATAASLVLKQARSTRTLPTLPADDFPVMREAMSARFSIEPAVLQRLIEATHAAQSDDATRVYLNGIYLHVSGDTLRAVGLDGLRMIRAQAPLPEGAADMPGMIIPSRAVSLIRKLILGGEALIEIEASAEKVALTSGSLRLVSKLIDQTYPDHERIIPKGTNHVVIAGRAALIDALSSVAAIVDGDGKAKVRTVRFDVAPGGEPELTARDAVGAASVEPLPAAYEGEGIAFGVNSRLLISTASAFREASTLRLELIDASTPFRITSEDEPDLLGLCAVNRV